MDDRKSKFQSKSISRSRIQKKFSYENLSCFFRLFFYLNANAKYESVSFLLLFNPNNDFKLLIISFSNLMSFSKFTYGHAGILCLEIVIVTVFWQKIGSKILLHNKLYFSMILVLFLVSNVYCLVFLDTISKRSDLRLITLLVINFSFAGLALLNYQKKRKITIYNEIMFIILTCFLNIFPHVFFEESVFIEIAYIFLKTFAYLIVSILN